MGDLGPYPSGPFTPNYKVGGRGGSGFQTCGWVSGQSSAVVKVLHVWWNSKTLRGLQVTYSDDSSSQVFGNASDNNKSIVFAPGELVTSLTLWGNGIGTRTGRIRITTTAGQAFDVGKDTSGQDTFSAPVGSGVLVGFAGKCGSDIDCLGGVFLSSKVESVAIKNVVFRPDLAGTSRGISNISLDKVEYPNNTNDLLNWTFKGGVTRAVSSTFTQGTTSTFSAYVKPEVTVSLFDLIKVTGSGVGAQWEHASSTTSSTTSVTERELAWEASGVLRPKESVICTALTSCGNIEMLNYTCTVVVKLADGSTNTYSESGAFNNVAYTEVIVKAENPTSADNKVQQLMQPIEVSSNGEQGIGSGR